MGKNDKDNIGLWKEDERTYRWTDKITGEIFTTTDAVAGPSNMYRNYIINGYNEDIDHNMGPGEIEYEVSYIDNNSEILVGTAPDFRSARKIVDNILDWEEP